MDGFDKKMDRRTISFEDPVETGDTVTTDWQVTYTLSGCPDLVITGKEIAKFEGDRIAHLEDVFDASAENTMRSWMTEHGARIA